MIWSLKAMLMESGKGWKRADGPRRFGPNLPWIFATTRRSIRVIYAKAVSSAKMTMAPLITEATIMLLRNSSMALPLSRRSVGFAQQYAPLLLLCAYSLGSQVFPRQAGIERVSIGNL